MASGRGAAVAGAPVNVAVPLASTYHADGPLSYGREGNAVWDALEEVLGSLEGGQALVFASGLAAIAAVLETLPVGALVVAPQDAYMGTRGFWPTWRGATGSRSGWSTSPTPPPR